MLYAELVINTPVNQTFSYHIPPALEGRVMVGHLVRVSFGTGMQPGIVIALNDSSPVEKTKPITELLDAEPLLQPVHIAMGLWLSEAYLTPPGPALWLFLPPGITGKQEKNIHLLQPDAEVKDAHQVELLAMLREESPLLQRQISNKLGQRIAAQAIKALARRDIVSVEAFLSRPIAQARTVRTVRLIVARESLAGTRLGRKQDRILRYLDGLNDPQDVSDIYEATDATAADLRRLADRGWVALEERPLIRDSLAQREFIAAGPHKLTAAQQAVWERLQDALDHAPQRVEDPVNPVSFLLHGVTGSGKTEIYLYAIAHVLAQGRQAIFLVPEIALTPQTIQRVASRFPDQVGIVHSGLSTGERYDTWQRARSGELRVIVGTRSALFTPMPDLGLIVIDEEHDPSYKQAPPIAPPYYQAQAAAEKLMQLNKGVLLMGSATPDLTSYYASQRGSVHYLHLPGRVSSGTGGALNLEMPPVQIVDMRAELKAGNRSMFSRDLRNALAEVLLRGEQAILFLNRRGQASYVFCRDCGYVVECDRCDMPMTYHRQGEAMRCHHCGNSAPVPTICPACRSERIRFFGAGTQQVEEELERYFPDARPLRWDADTASRPDMHEDILAAYVRHDADVLIGTQMIAKGLDLPMVTLVGVISADPGLALPDFRAHERAFQLLTQVSGRAGRGALGGRVIIQTYQPEHNAIQQAASHDYDAFYEQEIALRRELGYPPFRRMLRLLVQHTHPVQAQREAEDAAELLRRYLEVQGAATNSLIGPAPCFFSRIDKYYRWHVIVRGPDPLPALRGMPLRSGWYLDIDPIDLL